MADRKNGVSLVKIEMNKRNFIRYSLTLLFQTSDRLDYVPTINIIGLFINRDVIRHLNGKLRKSFCVHLLTENGLSMFLENTANSPLQRGWIEVICGSMFSGKTEELIRRLKRAEYARQKVEIFKPAIDTRYHAEMVVSHNENSIRSTPVTSSSSILLLASDINVVGIDEAQFFDMELVNVCNSLASRGIRVIIAGLDMDFRGVPFGPMPALMAVAEYVTKVHAICIKCGYLANHSYRLGADETLVVLGEKQEYEALCRDCYNNSQSPAPLPKVKGT